MHHYGLYDPKKVNVLGTRASRDQYEAVAAEIPAAGLHESARAITIKKYGYTHS